MPRGRNWYGPGFWKDAEWRPGAGGFRGGGYGPGPGWEACRWCSAGPGPYYAPGWYGPFSGSPEDEKTYLQEQANALKEELEVLEERIAELSQSE